MAVGDLALVQDVVQQQQPEEPCAGRLGQRHVLHGVEHRTRRQGVAPETDFGLDVQPQKPIPIAVVVAHMQIAPADRERDELLTRQKRAHSLKIRGVDEQVDVACRLSERRRRTQQAPAHAGVV